MWFNLQRNVTVIKKNWEFGYQKKVENLKVQGSSYFEEKSAH